MKKLLKSIPKQYVPGPLRRRMHGPDIVTMDCPLPGGRAYKRINGKAPYYTDPLEEPTWVTPDAATYLVEDDAILGFEINGRAHAVSWDVLAAHHVANLEIGGHPYLVTLCDACVGGGLYDAMVDGQRLEFRMEGVYDATPYVQDKQTGSLWTMVTMKPLHGEAVERGPLTRLPLVHVTWAEWKALHPDTLVVHDPGEPEHGHGGDHRWPGHSTMPGFAETRKNPVDPRLDPLALILGAEVDGVARAYQLDALHAAGGILNDTLNGRPIVAVALPGTYLCVAFHRDVDGQLLELAWDGGVEAATRAVDAGSEPPLLVDDATGSRWDLFGTAVSGPLAGAHLPYVWGGIQKWFNWSNLQPGAELWGGTVTQAAGRT
jgi:hypothetical protein